jgi:hypothetical protein
VKYTLARFGIFVACLLPALFLLPDVNLFLKLLIALLASSVASYFLLRPMAGELADRMNVNLVRRKQEKERLRAALAGEDEAPTDRDSD